MYLESLLTVAAMVGEVTLLIIFARRRIWRALPVFCASIASNFLTDALLFLAPYFLNPQSFLCLYIVATVIDSVMQYLVIIELTRAVLKPILRDRRRTTLWMLGGLIALSVLLIWYQTGAVVPSVFGPDTAMLFRLQETFAILRVIGITVVSIVSIVLSLSWKRLPFQVIAGLGTYSFFSLIVALLHRISPQSAGAYHLLDGLSALSYIGVLVYWVYCFSGNSNEFDGRERI